MDVRLLNGLQAKTAMWITRVGPKLACHAEDREGGPCWKPPRLAGNENETDSP